MGKSAKTTYALRRATSGRCSSGINSSKFSSVTCLSTGTLFGSINRDTIAKKAWRSVKNSKQIRNAFRVKSLQRIRE